MRCIIHNGYVSNAGYGLAYDPETKRTISAHRLAFKQAYGYLPEVVLHTCDTPTCINPEHLRGGTQSKNILDAISKGRYKKPTKLSAEQVLAIVDDDRTCRVIAKEYGVHASTISNIKRGKFYSDISGKGGTCGS